MKMSTAPVNRFSAAAAAAALLVCTAATSCVEDVIISEEQGDPIGFVTSVNTHSRAGHIHTTENLDSFRCYAFCPDGTEFFHDLRVDKVDPYVIPENYFHLSWFVEGGPYYYPRDAAWVDFWCYAYIKGFEGSFTNRETGEVLPKGVEITYDKQIIHNFEPVDDLPEQEDPIIEHKRVYSHEVSGIELHFKHATSQIELYAYAPRRDIRVMVAGAFFCNIIDHGDVIFPQPKEPYGIGDNSLYWILPERNDKGVVNEYHRRHYGDYFEEPIMLGRSIAGSIANRFPYLKNTEVKRDPDAAATQAWSRADGDEPALEPGTEGMYDHTDFNGDGICDHQVFEDVTQPDTLSHLLTFQRERRNMLLVSQQLTPYNRNRHIEYQGKDDERKSIISDSVNNHGAYILLLVSIYNVHGTPEHMHRHQIFPYRQEEIKDADGNITTPADVRAYDPNEFAWVCVPIDENWEPGCKYTYILEFMGLNSGAGIYPPDDIDLFGDASAPWVEMPSFGTDAASRPWQYTGPQLPVNSPEYLYPRPERKPEKYTIVPSPWVRFWDPGTEDMNHVWVKKKQGDPVLGRPIDFRVVVDEWIYKDPNVIEMEGVD